MHQHNPEAENAEREEKDSYDEFEERVRRVGVFVLERLLYIKREWHQLSFHKRAGHAIAFATLLSLIFYATYTVKIFNATDRTANIADASLARGTRPWIGLRYGGMQIASSLFMNGSKTATATLYYELRNDGHSPARVFIQGKIEEIIKPTGQPASQYPDIDWRSKAEAQCVEARKSLRYPLTILPNSKTSYGIVYDDQPPNGTTEYMETIKLEPPYVASKYREFGNFGCIIYQPLGSSDVYQTPFKAFLYRDLSTKEGFTLGGPWVIGNAN
jgi:hypothetical protein